MVFRIETYMWIERRILCINYDVFCCGCELNRRKEMERQWENSTVHFSLYIDSYEEAITKEEHTRFTKLLQNSSLNEWFYFRLRRISIRWSMRRSITSYLLWMASFLVVNLHVHRGKKHNQTFYSQRFFFAESDCVYQKNLRISTLTVKRV